MVLNVMIKAAWLPQQSYRQLMHVSCHVLGISAKIKLLFVWDNKDFVEAFGGIFRKCSLSEALLQFIVSSNITCIALILFSAQTPTYTYLTFSF